MQVILYLIDKLNIDKSPGPDGTHSRAVKELEGEIGELLAKTRKCSSQRDMGAKSVMIVSHVFAWKPPTVGLCREGNLGLDVWILILLGEERRTEAH